ncbi:leucine transcriptional activator [Yersinia frederiksenii]|uniref:Leucine transcriptional activator n=2 Tax=Yersinia frederiksenii TaxID=29484 RepID=A0A380Q075_YERFR|nr:LysR family transcriptional regulator [Yersinia frederiksenii]ATM96504.1 LysR family transcriptional regulator [Yersinia frederiksenii]EEQ13718.1 Transcriptional regulator [Yersinia frederiksenii ATCC 33641]KGA48135.1 bacterial regulatory helix-turn-helix, lysR family protein [Yersinia frederiksenii ATCC 33641]MDN0119833.1 LysR family transcriptional regulator [Yersinia frederiksenii]CFR04983.1 leucine transcriptional activator [Yersinia frederiksenii]
MEFPKFNTEILFFFKTLMETGSLTKTSEKLGMSQASASRQLAHLRKLFKDDLFIRMHYGMKPTERAKSLFPQVVATLFDLDQLLEPAQFDPKRLNGLVRIGAVDNGMFVILSKVINEVVKIAPQLCIEVTLITETLFSQIENGILDMAIYSDSLLPADFHQADLFEESFSFVVHKCHPLAYYAKVGRIPSTQEVEKYKRVVISVRGGRTGHVVTTTPFDEARQTDIICVPYFSSIPFLLKGSELTSVIPTRLARHFVKAASLVIIPSPNPPKKYNVRLIWHHRVHNNAANRWIRQLILSFAKEMDVPKSTTKIHCVEE